MRYYTTTMKQEQPKLTTTVEISMDELQALRTLIASAKVKCDTLTADATTMSKQSEINSLSNKLYKIGLNRIEIKWQ